MIPVHIGANRRLHTCPKPGHLWRLLGLSQQSVHGHGQEIRRPMLMSLPVLPLTTNYPPVSHALSNLTEIQFLQHFMGQYYLPGLWKWVLVRHNIRYLI